MENAIIQKNLGRGGYISESRIESETKKKKGYISSR